MNNISNRSSQPLIPSDAHGPAAENPENVSDNDLLLNLPISGDNRGSANQSKAPPIEKNRVQHWDSDPRGSRALKKGFVGSITRLAMKLLGKGSDLKKMQMEAKGLTEAQTRGRVRNYHNIPEDELNAQKYFSTESNSKVQVPKLQKGQLERVRFEYGERKDLNKKTLAAQHVALMREEPEFTQVKDITTLDGETVWHPVRAEMDETGAVELHDNQIFTTSERALGSSDLNNSYIRINDDGSINISTGAVDNEKRAEELMAVLGKAIQTWEAKNEGRIPPKLRLSMHQLNAFGLGGIGEESMIRRQHKMVAYIETHLRDRLEAQGVKSEWIPKGPVVAQLNRTMNGFTNIPGEGKKCDQVNIYGLAVQTSWMQEDLESKGFLETIEKKDAAYEAYATSQEAVTAQMMELRVARSELSEIERVHVSHEELALTIDNMNQWNDKIDACLKELRELPENAPDHERNELVKRFNQLENAQKATQERLEELQPISDESKARKKELNKKIGTAEKKLQKDLKELSKTMGDLAGLVDHEPEAQVRLELMSLLLASQTGENKDLSSAQQLQLMFLVDELNGAVTQSNCKSGLDRNGFARGLKSALRQHIKELQDEGNTPTQAIHKTAQFVIGFESRVKEMDQAWRDYSKENPTAQFHSWVEGRDYVNISNFQTKVFAALMGEGRPITHFSTGSSGGFKWHHTKSSINPLEKNPHPLPYMPVEVMNEGEAVQLIHLGRGSSRRFSEDGGVILEGQSQSRGG